MRMDLRGQPIHTRAMTIAATRAAGGNLDVAGSVLDLRKRGFVPVGSTLQGMGIIHHMELHAVVEPRSAVLESIVARQPTVAFEPSAATRGEGCRDPADSLARLAGTRLDGCAGGALKDVMGGVLGCSHLLSLAQFLVSTTAWLLRWKPELAAAPPADAPAGQGVLRRDLVFDAQEGGGGEITIGLQMADLHFADTVGLCLPMDRFAGQYELRLEIDLEGWPARFGEIRGGRRWRRRQDLADAAWGDCGELLAPLRGLGVGRDAAAELARVAGEDARVADALRMLGPALIQCRAAFPDKWLIAVATTPGHPGLIGLPDSCYMWRRGGALQQVRESLTGA